MIRCLHFVALTVISVHSLEEYTHLGSCKENTVPYRLTVDIYGKPELSCTVPFCFDLAPLNKNDEIQNKTCGGFMDDGCTQRNELVGGLMEVKNGDDPRLKTRCCSYSGVEQAKKVRTILLVPSDEFTGGVYVGDDGGWEGFDLVKDIRRVVEPTSVTYEIEVVRMPCQLKNLGSRRAHPSTENVFMQPSVQSVDRRRAPTNSMGFRRNLFNDYYYDDYEEQSVPQQEAGYGMSPSLEQAPLVVLAPPTPPPMTEPPTSPPPAPTEPQQEETTASPPPPSSPSPASPPSPPSPPPPPTTQETTVSPTAQPTQSIEKPNPKRIKFNPRWNKKEKEIPAETSSSTTETTTEQTTPTTTTEETSTERPVVVEHTLSPKEEESLKSSFVQQE